jgi:hypothetical protein
MAPRAPPAAPHARHEGASRPWRDLRRRPSGRLPHRQPRRHAQHLLGGCDQVREPRGRTSKNWLARPAVRPARMRWEPHPLPPCAPLLPSSSSSPSQALLLPHAHPGHAGLRGGVAGGQAALGREGAHAHRRSGPSPRWERDGPAPPRYLPLPAPSCTTCPLLPQPPSPHPRRSSRAPSPSCTTWVGCGALERALPGAARRREPSAPRAGPFASNARAGLHARARPGPSAPRRPPSRAGRQAGLPAAPGHPPHQRRRQGPGVRARH